jgi:hypothetical protein
MSCSYCPVTKLLTSEWTAAVDDDVGLGSVAIAGTAGLGTWAGSIVAICLVTSAATVDTRVWRISGDRTFPEDGAVGVDVRGVANGGKSCHSGLLKGDDYAAKTDHLLLLLQLFCIVAYVVAY